MVRGQPGMTATTSSRQLSCSCQRCASRLGVPSFVDTNPMCQPQAKPAYCPRCGKPHSYRPYDYADVLCTEYFGLTREVAVEVITTFNEIKASSNSQFYTASHGSQPVGKSKLQDPLDLLQAMGFSRMLMRAALTPLTVSCQSCGGSFTMLRSVPDVQRTPPLHCVWCSSTNLTTSQDDTEVTAWLSLASHYGLTVAAIQFFYSDWLKRGHQTTLAAHLADPQVAPLVQMAKTNASKQA